MTVSCASELTFIGARLGELLLAGGEVRTVAATTGRGLKQSTYSTHSGTPGRAKVYLPG